jgi:hypothetical protein
MQSDRNLSTHQPARPHIPKDSFRHDNLISSMKYDANNLSLFVNFSISYVAKISGPDVKSEEEIRLPAESNKRISETSVCSLGISLR